MRWLVGLLGALVFPQFISTPAAAATFIVNVSAPPTYACCKIVRHFAFGSATFPDVILHEGDSLLLNVEFGSTIKLPHLWFLSLSYVLNVPRGATYDHSGVRFNYPYVTNFTPISTGFSTEATAMNTYGPPDPSAFFDVDKVNYQIIPFPEPSTWILMLESILGLGAALRATRRPSSAIIRHDRAAPHDRPRRR